ncbi:inorganic diphosphatase [Neisseriaceae bacterium PsAf]|nr:inorganic diphosphatase [Neisseriaceae bacterium PsAf]MCV2502919.1 inorganic diphosphatase [Neisseriaceae bacterium]
MNISVIPPGKSFPDDFNAVIEISANSAPIKFEIDEESGAMAVDRFMGTSMTYPTNYGFVPNTLSGDGDPCDVLLITPFPVPPGVLVRCRAIGILDMEDDAGLDKKILAVPVEKLCPMYKKIQQLSDLPELLVQQIQHFFEHYKDLEPGKWVKIKGWGDVNDAKKELEDGVKNFQK